MPPPRPSTRCRWRLALALVTAALGGPAALAQPGETVSGTFSATLTVPVHGWTETASGSVRLRRTHADEEGAYYELESATLRWRASGEIAGSSDGCSVSGEATVTETDPVAAGLSLYSDSTYSASSAAFALHAVHERVLVTCRPPAPREPYSYWLQAGLQDFLYVPTSADNGGEWFRVAPGGALAGSWSTPAASYTWSLAVDVGEVELVVEPDGYAAWLPAPGKDEDDPGTTISVLARLVGEGGEPVEASRFRFELVGTSREPGVAINYPRPDLARATPDLRLTDAVDVTDRDEDDGQWIETGPGDRAMAEVSAFDGGAFATLRVTATLAGGREVVGHLVGEPGREAVPLPKRAEGSLVADAWLASVGGGADADDRDGDPDGDDHAGDGLTLYEEYRGVVENGRHVRTDPRRKDLFVLNTIGGAVTEGVLLFAALSGLDVHHELTLAELDPSRVVNANHAAGPHAVDQHGLWLRRFNAGFGETAGGPGTPKTIRHIDLADLGYGAAAPDEPAVNRRLRLAHVAHELFHGVNVWHHGDGDDLGVRWVARTDREGRALRAADGSFLFRDAAGRDLDVRTEGGGPYVPTLGHFPDIGRPGLEVLVGYTHGEHSGDEGCVMRYKVAQFSAESRAATLRYRNGTPQAVGLGLCELEDGTGANADGHAPRPRYGDADGSADDGPRQRGRCRHQVCVNDAHDHR